MSQSDDLAAAFLAVHQEFYDFIREATPEQWRVRGINHPEITVGDEDEGRPVGVIVHHVATGYARNLDRSRAWIRGEDPDPPTGALNKVHHEENPDPDKEETLRFLQHGASEMAAFIRGLSESDVAKEGRFATGPTTVGDFVGRILPYHVRWHMGSIRATWEDLASRSAATTG